MVIKRSCLKKQSVLCFSSILYSSPALFSFTLDEERAGAVVDKLLGLPPYDACREPWLGKFLVELRKKIQHKAADVNRSSTRSSLPSDL